MNIDQFLLKQLDLITDFLPLFFLSKISETKTWLHLKELPDGVILKPFAAGTIGGRCNCAWLHNRKTD